jgi:hypothetical protein
VDFNPETNGFDVCMFRTSKAAETVEKRCGGLRRTVPELPKTHKRPKGFPWASREYIVFSKIKLVAGAGFEPATFGL